VVPEASGMGVGGDRTGFRPALSGEDNGTRGLLLRWSTMGLVEVGVIGGDIEGAGDELRLLEGEPGQVSPSSKKKTSSSSIVCCKTMNVGSKINCISEVFWNENRKCLERQTGW